MIAHKSYVSRRAIVRGGLAVTAAAAFWPNLIRAADAWEPVRAAINDSLPKSGVSLLVLTPDQIRFHESFGPALIQIPGILASASMGPSALAILALADRGAIGLDDPIGKHVRSFAGEKSAITVRQCLAHTSGLVDAGNMLTPPVKDPGVSLEEEVDQAARSPLRTAPGKAFAFGGMDFQAAGRAAEVASGMPWELLFQQLLNDPIGAGFTYGETPDPRLAGGASATIDSYGAVLKMILNDGDVQGARVVSKVMIKALRTNQIGRVVSATPLTSNSGAHGYGLGWWLEELDGHGLAKRINAAGAYGTIPWIDFEKRYAAILMMEDKQAAGVAMSAKIRPMIEAAIA